MGIAIGNTDGTLCGVYALVRSHSADKIAKKKIRDLIKRFAEKRDDVDYTTYDGNRCGVYRKAVVKVAKMRRKAANQMTADLAAYLLGRLSSSHESINKQETHEFVDGAKHDVTILTLDQTGRKRRRVHVVD